MSTKLLELTLEEVSLVDSPANKAATVALFKRDNNMDEDTIKKLADQCIYNSKGNELELHFKA